MTVSTHQFLKETFQEVQALGDKVVSSDSALEIVGHEGLWLITKQFPWPIMSSMGEIEVPGPLGIKHWQAQQAKAHHQGQVTFQEVVSGAIDNMLAEINARGGYFDAKVYEGTPEVYLRYKPIYRCFLNVDTVDRDTENVSQLMTISGTMFFHYFGEVVAGNSDDYRPRA